MTEQNTVPTIIVEHLIKRRWVLTVEQARELLDMPDADRTQLMGKISLCGAGFDEYPDAAEQFFEGDKVGADDPGDYRDFTLDVSIWEGANAVLPEHEA